MKEARSSFEEAIKRDPGLIANYFGRGDIYTRLDENDLTANYEVRDARIRENNVKLAVTRRQAAMRLGNSAEITEELTHLIGLPLVDIDAHRARAMAYTIQGSDNQAHRDIEKAASLGADRYQLLDSIVGIVDAFVDSGQTVDATRVVDALLVNQSPALQNHPSLAIRVQFLQGLAQLDLEEFLVLAPKYLGDVLDAGIPVTLVGQVRLILTQAGEASARPLSVDDFSNPILSDSDGPVSELRRELLAGDLSWLDPATPDTELDPEDRYPFPGE